MSKLGIYQKRINAILLDEEFKVRCISCIVSEAGFENGEPYHGEIDGVKIQMFTYMWYFYCDGQKTGMPNITQPELDHKGIRGMARDVMWHHDEYNGKYGKKNKGFFKKLFS